MKELDKALRDGKQDISHAWDSVIDAIEVLKDEYEEKIQILEEELVELRNAKPTN